MKKLNFNNLNSSNNVEPEREIITYTISKLSNCLILLCKSHVKDGMGTDEDELINCAGIDFLQFFIKYILSYYDYTCSPPLLGQYVMYHPPAAYILLNNILKTWPTRSSDQQLFFVKLCARILMVYYFRNNINYFDINFLFWIFFSNLG